MSLLLTMLPVYLFGNLHCAGMCGPLVIVLGKHRYRLFYFFGRTVSFSLAGFAAGSFGAVLNLVLRKYQIPAAASLLFGIIMVFLGLCSLLGQQIPGHMWLGSKLSGLSRYFSLLMLRDQPLPAFLFGFFTVALPCGQTLVVFSACALEGDPLIGLLNGMAFALLTSPSLYFAMSAHKIVTMAKKHYNLIIGVSAVAIGGLSLCRGLSEAGIIPHFVVNPQSSPYYHLVLF